MRCTIMVIFPAGPVFKNTQFCLDFEVFIHYIMLRRGGLYDESRYHLRSF